MSSFWLEYIQDGQRREFSFDKASVSVGRDKASDFVVDHPTVSRQHALIVAGQQGHQLVVLSRGGLTAVDGAQVHGEVLLYDGNEIHFGQLSFTFRSHTAPRKPAPGGQNGWNQAGNFSSQPGVAPQAQPSPDPRQTGGFGQQSLPQPSPAFEQQSFGQMPGFGSAAPAVEPAQGAAQVDSGWGDPADDDLVSWDQIAQAAEDEERAGKTKAETDFERIQAAQAKAEAQSKGNPLIIAVGVVGIVALLAFSFWPASETADDTEDDPIAAEKPFIDWQKGDIDCVGTASCEASALAAYQVGRKTWEQKGADITNLFESYRQFDRATLLLEKGGITVLPAEMADVEERKKVALAEMEARFQQYRVKFHNLNKRSMYREMADVLRETRAYFPDKRAKYHQWALQKEREMKDDGVYPQGVF